MVNHRIKLLTIWTGCYTVLAYKLEETFTEPTSLCTWYVRYIWSKMWYNAKFTTSSTTIYRVKSEILQVERKVIALLDLKVFVSKFLEKSTSLMPHLQAVKASKQGTNLHQGKQFHSNWGSLQGCKRTTFGKQDKLNIIILRMHLISENKELT